jgi:hypothetical protein
MRRVAIWIFSAVLPAALALGAVAATLPGVAHAGEYDGDWTVRVITERGKCDSSSSYNVQVAGGKVRYTSYNSVSLWGTVSPSGAVSVSIRHFDDGANGSGHLMKRTGTGGWHGVGKKGPCSGRWEARRR